jgi:hypothetical protein
MERSLLLLLLALSLLFVLPACTGSEAPAQASTDSLPPPEVLSSTEASLPDLVKRCFGGEDPACIQIKKEHSAAVFEFQNTDEAPGSEGKTIQELFTRLVEASTRQGAKDHGAACEAGNADSCWAVGSQLLCQSPGCGKDEVGATVAFQRACDLGSQVGCRSLADSLVAGRGTPQDLQKAVSLYRGACGAGEIGSCFELGRLSHRGVGVERDSLAALERLLSICERPPGGAACSYAGCILARGDGVPQDMARAEQLFVRACEVDSSSMRCNPIPGVKPADWHCQGGMYP